MPASRHSVASGVVAVVAVAALAVDPVAAAEKTGHVDPPPADFDLAWFVGIPSALFAFGLLWVNVLVHLLVPWRRVRELDGWAAAAVGGGLNLLAVGVLVGGDLVIPDGWYALPAVVAANAVGYVSVAGGVRGTVAAGVATVLVLVASLAVLGWPFPDVGLFGVALVQFLGGRCSPPSGPVSPMPLAQWSRPSRTVSTDPCWRRPT